MVKRKMPDELKSEVFYSDTDSELQKASIKCDTIVEYAMP